MQILYRTTAPLHGMCLSGLGHHTSYNWQATCTASKLFPKVHHILIPMLLGLLFTYFGRDTFSQATSGLLNACVTGYE